MSGYKPVHLLGTANNQGILNLAVFSQVMHIGANPPMLGVLFRPNTVPRHSLTNIRDTGFFTLNHVTNSMIEQTHQTAAKYAEDKSEFEAVGLSSRLNETHPAPYVAESPIQIGLKFKEEILIQSNQTVLVIGEITDVTLENSAIRNDGYVDLASQEIVCCTGIDAYHLPLKVKRLSYAEPTTLPVELTKELF
jgi:flavin reductase (DIM6/NTAB) family NADH-FMN oxidoreductase RutF